MNNIEKVTRELKALADQTRLQIIDLLACGQMCVCDLTEELDLSQPNMSHHLRILKNAELIIGIKKGRWVYYKLNQEKLEELEVDLNQIINKSPTDCDFERSNCEDRE
ncbi:ArsR/SmtB family transcription factor [Halanaerobaculum tunisiense]